MIRVSFENEMRSFTAMNL